MMPKKENYVEGARLFDNQKLAQRAKHRRTELGLSVSFISDLLEIKRATLVNWEKELTNKPKLSVEQKWEQALRVPCGWIRDSSIEAINIVELFPLDVSGCDYIQEEIHGIATWLCRTSPAKRTIYRKELTDIEKRNAEIFELRYGYGGKEIVTLESIGNKYGLTRERVRQISEKMLSRIQGHKVITPLIEGLQADIKTLLPAPVKKLNQHLKDKLGHSISLTDLNRFCNEVLGLHLVYLNSVYYGRPSNMTLLVWADDQINSKIEKEFLTVRSITIKMITNVGAAHIHTIVGLVSQKLNTSISYLRVLSLCKSIDGFSWLSKSFDWFWLGPKTPRRSRLINSAKKTLIAAGGYVDKTDIQEGLLQTRRHLSQISEKNRVQIEIPVEILAEVLRNTPGFIAKQYDDFALEELTDTATLLGETEYKVFNIIEGQGGIASRRLLMNEICEKQGVNLVTFQAAIERSPVIKHIQRSIYGIRGRAIPSTPLSKAIEESNLPSFISFEGKDDYDLQLEEDGGVEFCINAGVNAVKVGSLVLPANVSKIVTDGEYTIQDEKRKIQIRTVACGATYARLLLSRRKEEISIGDIVKIKIYPGQKIISFTLENLQKTAHINN